MDFDPHRYGPEMAAILKLEAQRRRRMPLVSGTFDWCAGEGCG